MNSAVDCHCILVNILLSVYAGLLVDNILHVVLKNPPVMDEAVHVLELV